VRGLDVCRVHSHTCRVRDKHADRKDLSPPLQGSPVTLGVRGGLAFFRTFQRAVTPRRSSSSCAVAPGAPQAVRAAFGPSLRARQVPTHSPFQPGWHPWSPHSPNFPRTSLLVLLALFFQAGWPGQEVAGG